ncbi:Ref family recombination enhancement nuclease [Serratia ureilytica]
MATKDEKQWLSDVADLGCVVCRNLGYGPSPAEIHHIRTGQGTAQRATHKQTLPLCPTHHRTGGHGVAVHAGRKTWEKNYGSELELLEQVTREVEELRECRI